MYWWWHGDRTLHRMLLNTLYRVVYRRILEHSDKGTISDLVDNILQEVSFVTGNLKNLLLSQTVFHNVFKTYHVILDPENIFYKKIITMEQWKYCLTIVP